LFYWVVGAGLAVLALAALLRRLAVRAKPEQRFAAGTAIDAEMENFLREAEITTLLHLVAEDGEKYSPGELARTLLPRRQEIIDALESQERSHVLAAATVLGYVRWKQGENALLKLLASENEEYQMAASFALQKINDPALVRRILRDFRESGRYLPARVAEIALAQGSKALDEVLEALKTAADPAASGLLIDLLGELGDKRAVPVLEGFLDSGEPRLKVKAICALDRIGDGRVAQSLLKALNDPGWPVRAQAAKALGRLGRDESLAMLEDLLNDPDWHVRTNAREALDQLQARTVQ